MFTAVLLDRSRYAVDVVSGPQTGSEGSLIEEVRARGVSLTLEPAIVREVDLVKDLIALFRLTCLIKKGRYTIVHTHSSKAGILGRMAARWAGVPIIVHTVHGWSFHDHMAAPARRAYVFLERLMATFSDALVVVARPDIEKGLRAGVGKPEQYHLIRSAIPLDEFDVAGIDRDDVRRELGLPLDAPVLGNVGRFSPQKNPLEWVRVAAKVGRELPQCHFLLVGDGPLRSQVEAALVETGIAGRAVLTGLRRDVPRMLAAMDVFLLTSLWEGLPRVIPQAMSMELPVVASGADGVSEAIRHGGTGFLCAPGDIEGMARCCVTLLCDAPQRHRMGERGRVYARQEFDVRQMAVQIAELYETLLSRSSLG